MADETKKIIFDIEVEGIQSIENLNKQNRILREERNKLNLQSEEGKRIAEKINKQLDSNTQKIKENSSAVEQQRLNVGNYTGALDKLVPGLGATAKGFIAMKDTAMSFIATPLGLVVGALGLALGALISYIKGSDEGADRFAKTTAALGFVFEKLKLIVENVGGFIFDTIEFIAGGVEKVIGFISPAAGAAIAEAKKAGAAIADIQDEIENKENAFLIKRAETNEKVQALREKAITQEGKAKKATIEEAIALEKELANKEMEFAKLKVKAFELENKQRIAQGKLTAEQIKQQAELEADVINQRSAGAQATIKYQKEVEKLRDDEVKAQEKLNELREIELKQKEDLETIQDRLAKQKQVEIPLLKIEVKEKGQINKALDGLIKKNEEATDKTKENAETAKKASQDQVKEAIALSAAIIGLGDRQNKAARAAGLTTIGINAGIAVSGAIKQAQSVPFPANIAAILSGITAVITGITQAKNLLGYATGGLSGMRIGSNHGTRINRSNGDNLLATVKVGEVILNERQQRALGGDATFARIGVPGFASGGMISSAARASESSLNMSQLFDAISQIQPIVTVEDINAVSRRVAVIDSRARFA